LPAQDHPGRKKKGVAYIRVSALMGRGEELISPEIQMDAIKAYADRHDIEVVDQIPDIDKSGRSFTKRRVNEVIEGIQEGLWTYVLLWKWSRWGRNLQRSLVHLSAVEAAGGIVRAATEDFDPTTTMGKFTRDQMLLIAELQSNQISDGWRETHAIRRKMGLPFDGKPRWGYIYEDTKGAKRYVPDPELAPVLKDLYEGYVAGAALRSLALELNARGLRTVKGTQWQGMKLGTMMDTGFAAGWIREKSDVPGEDRGTKRKGHSISSFDIWYEGSHEAIISQELWERYKARRAEQAAMPARTRTATYALSGLLTCGYADCGRNMVPHHRTGRNEGQMRWICHQAKHYKAHPYNSISDKRAMADVLAWVEEQVEGGADVTERARRYEVARKSASEAKDFQAEIDRLVAKRKRLIDFLADERITDEEFDEQTKDIAEQIETATAGRDAAKARESAAGVGLVVAFGALRDAWPRLQPNDHREALSKVVSQIVVGPSPYAHGRNTLRVLPKWEE